MQQSLQKNATVYQHKKEMGQRTLTRNVVIR